jgi:TP901 family phage tail tape measure protein
MQETVQFSINFGGDYHENITEMTAATGKLNEEVKKSQDLVGKLGQTFMGFKAFNDVVRDVANGIGELTKGGITLDSQMHDLSAVAGVTGDTLRQIEGYARESAKTFGTDAAVAVEGYKLLLSQLTPELAKCPEALSAMGDSIQITSKLMGGDGVAAAQVLTTAMNQYGVSMDDPIAASREMARMMNVMAAAGQAGSAELPAISAALSQCGMAAKAANVSFEETNAAIQVLDKAGKKASEGGVALRNTLAILGRGRFLPPKTQEELAAAGINVDVLADKNLSLHDRLEALKPILRDDALLSQMFGMENANAARALIQGTDALRDFTDAVTGTNSAEEQAAIVMDSYAERQARINQRIEDFKISLFQATGDLTLWLGSLTGVATTTAQLLPLLTAMWKVMHAIKNVQWAKTWSDIGKSIRSLKGDLYGFALHSMLAFDTFKVSAITSCRAVGLAIKSIPIVGWIAAGIAALVGLFTWLWDKSESFREVCFGVWEVIKVGALAVWDVIKPFVLQLWERLKLIGSTFRWFWTEMPSLVAGCVSQAVAKVRGYLQLVRTALGALWDYIGQRASWLHSKVLVPIRNFFRDLWRNTVRPVLDSIGNRLRDIFAPIAELWNRLTGAVTTAYAVGAEKGRASWAADHPGSGSSEGTSADDPFTSLGSSLSPMSGSSSFDSSLSASGGVTKADHIRNINIRIDRLVERLDVTAANLPESAERIRDEVTRALMGALNDVQLAI